MQKLISLGNKFFVLAFLTATLGFGLPAQAASPTWDTTGSYVVSFDGYNHDMFLTQDSLGNVTGNGGYLAGTLPYSYAWSITSGTVVGNVVNLTADYTFGAIGTTMHMNGIIAPNGSLSGTWDDNYGGPTRNGTWSTVSGTALIGALSPEDFGVVNYNTGLGILKGYTAGFGLTDATFENVQSVVVKLYSGATLLQTNTATAQVGIDIIGSQISSPFDVSGTFDYVTDGYWVNVRETQYGQSMPATKVVATVILENGKIVTAENIILSGDPTTIYPAPTQLLTVALVGTGSGVVNSIPLGINCGVDCTESYTNATSVTLTATPTIGSTFTGWSGPCLGTGTCTVTMNNAMTATATFTLIPVVINYPTNKDACKNGGWETFNSPSFKNQGQCVSWANHQ